MLALAVPLGGAAPARGPAMPVELPALLPQGLSGWRYATCDGVEVLALAPEEAVRTYTENIALQRANLDAVLPGDLRIGWDRPITVLLYGVENPQPLPAGFAEVLGEVYTERERARALENREAKPLDVRVEPKVMHGAFFPDADSICVFNILQPKVKASGLSALPAAPYVAFLLQSRTPPLPAWFMDGMFQFYAQATLAGADFDVPPFIWVSVAQTTLMLKDKSMPAEFLPMSEVFAWNNSAALPTDERRQLTLRSQSGLFVRWVFEGRVPGGPEALWKFVRNLRPGVEHEVLFKESFGMGTQEAVEAMRAYLPGALRKPLRVRVTREGRLPSIEVRPATPVEVVRMRAEWERLSCRMVKTAQPKLLGEYEAHARSTFATGAAQAATDPGLQAAHGLLLVELGEDAAARPLLESACAGAQPRARAVVELARIRLAEAKAALPAGARLDAGVAAAIVDPLRNVLGARPPIPRAWQVMAETWLVCATPPSPADLELLASGVRTIPGDAAMVIPVARLLIDRGRLDEARAAIEGCLGYTTDDASRRRLYAIRSAIRAAAPKTP